MHVCRGLRSVTVTYNAKTGNGGFFRKITSPKSIKFLGDFIKLNNDALPS